MSSGRPDLVRQVAVTASAVICVVGTLYGIGIIGTEVQDSSGGRLSADATLIAPAGPAFSIWSAIYIGLAAFTVWQWTPAAATSHRIRGIGGLAAASMLLNAGWLLVTQVGWLPASVAVIVALLAVLLVLNQRLTARAPANTVERVVVDATFGLYLGWVSVATFANIAAVVTDPDTDPISGLAQAAAVATLLIVGGVGVLLSRLLGARVAVAAAMVWGLAWIAIARSTDEPRSPVTAIAAVIAAGIIAVRLLVGSTRRRGPVSRAAAPCDQGE
jgi:hypothetical protein